MTDEIYRYILGHLSVLSDEQLGKLNFKAGLSFVDHNIDGENAKKIKKLLLSVQKQAPLSHYGILGQKWGVRRYQNKDGTLTSIGKQRLSEGASIFKKSSKFEMRMSNGETINAKPMPPPSMGKKLLNFLLEDIIDLNDDAGYRGDANYVLNNLQNRKIGELSLISKDSESVYLDWFKIEKNQRGKGYGVDIINSIIEKARNAGYSKIETDVSKEVRPFYEKMGFTYAQNLNAVNRIINNGLGIEHMERNLNELSHHGILGQKWGIRRFQNEDGSLTAAGKAHQEKIERKNAVDQKKADVKNRGTFTTKQLREKIEKIQLEKQLRELTNEELYPGRKAVYQALSNIGTKVATTAISGGLLYGISAAVSGKFDIKELGSSLYYGGPKKK